MSCEIVVIRTHIPVVHKHSTHIPVGGFLHCIVFWGVPQGVFILVSRSIFGSGSCPNFIPKTHFLTTYASIWRAGCRRGISGVFLHSFGHRKTKENRKQNNISPNFGWRAAAAGLKPLAATRLSTYNPAFLLWTNRRHRPKGKPSHGNVVERHNMFS